MSRLKNAYVTLTLDTTAFEASMRQAARAVAKFQRAFGRVGRSMWRANLTPGERHIDKIIRDCLDRRLSVDETALRLYVATACAAPVLDEQVS